jgi:RNA polymerase sigma-70 factor, ECF subfamily
LSLPFTNQVIDPNAFAEIFEQYKNLVYKTAYLMMDDPAEADDVLQEVFILVYKSLSAFDPKKGAFTTWLHRITVNCCLMQRRKRRFLFLPLDSLWETPSGKSLENARVELDEKERVMQAIRVLSDKQRAVIVLRYYLELPYTEIAQVLDIPLGTVKSRLDGSLRRLRQSLTGSNEGISNPSIEMEVDHEL